METSPSPQTRTQMDKMKQTRSIKVCLNLSSCITIFIIIIYISSVTCCRHRNPSTWWRGWKRQLCFWGQRMCPAELCSSLSGHGDSGGTAPQDLRLHYIPDCTKCTSCFVYTRTFLLNHYSFAAFTFINIQCCEYEYN